MKNETKKSWVCIDASLVMLLVTPNPIERQLDKLFATWQETSTCLTAPTHILYEVTSSLRRMVYLKYLTSEQGQQALEDFLALNIATTSSEQMVLDAWNLSIRFNRPRAYDSLYLAVAQQYECEFWTADKRIYNAVIDELSWVHCVGLE